LVYGFTVNYDKDEINNIVYVTMVKDRKLKNNQVKNYQ